MHTVPIARLAAMLGAPLAAPACAQQSSSLDEHVLNVGPAGLSVTRGETTMKSMVILALIALALTSLAAAADPPERINYQGVLRNNADAPLDGTFAMTFRFFNAASGGDEILVDTQGSVTVSGGLFNVELGGGTITDGSGPGIFTSLAAVFAEYSDLYLQVEVNGETLVPRTPVAAAGYALNARSVRGREVFTDGPLDLWVDASAGNDEKDGLTEATAKATIQAALDTIPTVITANVIVHVKPGIYAELLYLSRHVLNGGFHNIALINDPGSGPSADVEIDGTGLFPGAPFGSLVSLGGAFVSVDGFVFRDFKNPVDANDSEPVAVKFFGVFAEFSNCEFRNNGTGFQTSGDVVFDNCTFSNNEIGLNPDSLGEISADGCAITGNRIGVRVQDRSAFHTGSGTSIDNNSVAGVEILSTSYAGFGAPCTITNNDLEVGLNSYASGWCDCVLSNMNCTGNCIPASCP